MQQKDALTILLTGRSEPGFASLIKRMAASRKLEFDMVCLKPQVGPNNQKFRTTMHFKQTLLEEILFTYKSAEDIRVYEDRVKHVQAFREFFANLNRNLAKPGAVKEREPFTAEVVQVAEDSTVLDPVVEAAEIQQMINEHNIAFAQGVRSLSSRLRISRLISCTGYLIAPEGSSRLLGLVRLPPQVPDSDVKKLASHIVIAQGKCPVEILEKAGGIGNKVTWIVTGIGNLDNRLWAASIEPLHKDTRYVTEQPAPIVVLAHLKGATPSDASRIRKWQPALPSQAVIFDTVVGEKELLRIERENLTPDGRSFNDVRRSKGKKRRFVGDNDHDRPANPQGRNNESERRVNNGHHGYQSHSSQQQHHPSQSQNYSGRAGRGGGGGGGGGNGGRGRGTHRGGSNARGGRSGGRNGPYGYRSLDDMPVDKGLGGVGTHGGATLPSYDDHTSSYDIPQGVQGSYAGDSGLPYNGS
ncbi:MAG: hypothetical protein M1825_004220 [Sarcosagium campestre]|nr:MAG: hypothetical protein M1825_004220 [Sarcosagium campestre]